MFLSTGGDEMTDQNFPEDDVFQGVYGEPERAKTKPVEPIPEMTEAARLIYDGLTSYSVRTASRAGRAALAEKLASEGLTPSQLRLMGDEVVMRTGAGCDPAAVLSKQLESSWRELLADLTTGIEKRAALHADPRDTTRQEDTDQTLRSAASGRGMTAKEYAIETWRRAISSWKSRGLTNEQIGLPYPQGLAARPFEIEIALKLFPGNSWQIETSFPKSDPAKSRTMRNSFKVDYAKRRYRSAMHAQEPHRAVRALLEVEPMGDRDSAARGRLLELIPQAERAQIARMLAETSKKIAQDTP